MLNRNVLIAGVFAMFCSLQTNAYGYDALEVCRGQSTFPPDVSKCMDNYLDLLDQNLGDLTIFIDGELRGGQRAAFNRAQNSFYSYRRENCLWYLSLGGERVEAEQVAKNCLAEMSQDRLAEMQGLIASYPTPGLDGALVENPFEEPKPEIVENAQAAVAEPATVQTDSLSAEGGESNSVDNSDVNELSAYLGQWQVICTNSDSSRRCTLDVPLESVGGESGGALMRVTRRANERAGVELQFPNHSIESPDNVLWRVDNFAFGAVPGSIIRVSEGVARQVINERKFLRDDLLPLFRSGSEVGITLAGKAGESGGDEFEATLDGFSRALTFADEYINGELQ